MHFIERRLMNGAGLGLRQYFVLLLVLSLIPALIVTALVVNYEQQELIEDATREAITLNRIAVTGQEQLIARVEQFLVTLATMPQVTEGGDACFTLLAQMREQQTIFTNFGVVNREGDIFCAGLPASQPVNVTDRGYFQRAMAEERLSIGEYQIGRITGLQALNFAYPWYDSSGTLGGVIYAGLHLDVLNDILSVVDLPDGTTLTLVDRTGIIVGRIPGGAEWIGRDSQESDLIQSVVSTAELKTFHSSGLDDIERLYATAVLGPDSDLFLAMGIPTSVAYSQARSILIGHLLTLGLFMAILGLVGALGAEKVVFNPFNAFVATVNRVRAGDLTARVPDVFAPRELLFIATTFDKLSRSLQQREAEREQALAALEKARDELERRVQERTAALTATNQALETQIHERTLAEQAVKQERNLLRAVIDNIPDAIYVKDRAGRYIVVNQTHLNYLGADSQEAIIERRESEVAPELAREAAASEQAVIDSGVSQVNVEEQFNDPETGAERWLLATRVPLRNAAGVLTGLVGIQRDITSRKKSEHQINQLNEALAHRAQELEAVNKELEAFSYSVSHDLRAPLRAMNGFSRILLDDYAETMDAEAQRYLQLVNTSAGHMAQLIDDLLNFSRLSRQPLNKHLVEPGVVAQSVVDDLCAEQPERKIEIVIDDLPPCQADPALLRQVYANLIGNAFKFTGQRDDVRVHIGAYHDRETVYFVRDNGAGFDMRYQTKLFGVFQRLHRTEEFEGTGVGLAIVQRIIHRHGGRIWPEAALGQGATFYFTLEGES